MERFEKYKKGDSLRAAMEKGITVYYKTRKGKLVGVDSTHAIIKLDGVETTVRAKHKYVYVYAEIY